MSHPAGSPDPDGEDPGRRGCVGAYRQGGSRAPCHRGGIETGSRVCRQPANRKCHGPVETVERRHFHRVGGVVASRDGRRGRRGRDREGVHDQRHRGGVHQTRTAAGTGDREGIGSDRCARAGGDVHRAVARAAADRVCAECRAGARREPAHAQCHAAGKSSRRSYCHCVAGRPACSDHLR